MEHSRKHKLEAEMLVEEPQRDEIKIETDEEKDGEIPFIVHKGRHQ